MEKIGYAFIEHDRSIYPEGSYLREFCEDEENLLVIYPLDLDGDEADVSELAERYGTPNQYGNRLFDNVIIRELAEWIFEYDDREEVRKYLNGLGFEETNVLIERFDDLPL